MVCLLIMRSILRSSSVSPILFYLDLCLVMRDRDSAFSLVDFYCISSKKCVWQALFPAVASSLPYSACCSAVCSDLRPQEAMTDLPFIGKLNTVFVVAIAIGMGIILLCMILNIINSVKEHNTEKTWFDTNGAAGLVFYFALATVIVLYMSGNALPATIVLTVLFIIPLLLMFFKEPLSAMVEKKAQKMEGGVGMFITQGVFELFEVLLSYFSNTLSFVRVGAFAVSHAAMMQVVLMLAGAEAGSPNWAVVIGGNLFVCGMEGLIVGIQVLRLEYYELFSRFYRGSGRAFEPYGKH